MKVIVDTPVWSAAYRRRGPRDDKHETDTVDALRELLGEGRCVLLGVVRQEVLQGIVRKDHFRLVETDLAEFPDEPVWSADHVRAAGLFNRCRGKGIQPTTIDMLICALALRLRAAVFTLDRDFLGYSRVLGVRLHRPVVH